MRKYEQASVLITLDGKQAIRGYLQHVGPDHVALVDAAGIVLDETGKAVVDPATPGPHIVERRRIVRMQVLPS